jgi:hypothetical protein
MMNDQSHFSEEDRGLLLFYFIALIIFGGTLGTNIYNFIKEFKTYEKTETPNILLMLAITLHMAHSILQMIHFWFYSSNGSGLILLDILSTI